MLQVQVAENFGHTRLLIEAEKTGSEVKIFKLLVLFLWLAFYLFFLFFYFLFLSLQFHQKTVSLPSGLSNCQEVEQIAATWISGSMAWGLSAKS